MTVSLLLGDCRDILPTLDRVDAIITDPPYGVGAASWDAEVPYSVLPEFLRLSRGLVLWFGSALKLRDALIAFSTPPQRVLIWYVTFSLARAAAHGIFYVYHPIYAWNLPKKQDGVARDVIPVPQSGVRMWWRHPGTKPIELMRQLVNMTPPSCTILDPFMGSGTTGVACIETGRSFIGIEIDPAIYAVAQERIEEAEVQVHRPGFRRGSSVYQETLF